MTEDQIERRVERMMDHLDRLLLAGQMPQQDYDAAVKDLDAWAKARNREAGR
jgi:hypothetical protein